MQVTFDELQDALTDGRITKGQFLSVLEDNFGIAETMKILDHNMDIAIAKGETGFYEF